MDIKAFNKELGDYDLFVECTLVKHSAPDGYGVMRLLSSPKVICWIENISDPSVGIFGNRLTPCLDSLDELYAYWQSHKDEIVEAE